MQDILRIMRPPSYSAPMATYALTYPQLMNQALQAEVNMHGLLRIQAAHDFAEAMVDGMYRAQGVPFLTHLIRTASIALAHEMSLCTVLASMAHAAFILRKFEGSRRQAFRSAHQRDLRAALGDDVERRVTAYEQLPWHQAGALQTHRRNLESYDTLTRDVLAMRLANELEDLLDGALAFTQVPTEGLLDPERRQDCMALAEQMDLATLARELSQAYLQHESMRVPAALVRPACVGYERNERMWSIDPAQSLARKTLIQLRSIMSRSPSGA